MGNDDEFMENKAHVSIITIIDHVLTDIVNDYNTTNGEMCGVIVAETMSKLVHDPKIKKCQCQKKT